MPVLSGKWFSHSQASSQCLALLPRAAASAGLGTDPAIHSTASAPEPDLQRDFPTLIMKTSKQLREEHFKLYWLQRVLTRKVFRVPLCGSLQPALCSAPQPQHPWGPWCGGQEAGWAWGAPNTSKFLQTTASTVRNLDMFGASRALDPFASHRTSSPKHPSSLHFTLGLSKN